MKKPLINKSHVGKWNDEDFARLLINYYKFYQNSYSEWEHDDYRRSSYRPVKCDRVWFNRFTHYGGRRIKWHLLHEMYVEGHFVLKKLRCSFFEFCDYMIYGVPSKYYKLIAPPTDLRKGYWFWGWGWSRKNDFMANNRRTKLKYQKKSHHKKKEKSEDRVRKEDWRKKKGIDRDKRKPNYSRRTSCPKWYKRKGNKAHRTWERTNIAKGDWEELSNYKKWDEMLNPWDWD